jgi:hypothetical protein
METSAIPRKAEEDGLSENKTTQMIEAGRWLKIIKTRINTCRVHPKSSGQFLQKILDTIIEEYQLKSALDSLTYFGTIT